MAVRYRTKKRTLKPDGTRNPDMCPCCISFYCDPTAMSEAFRRKIEGRLRKGLCPTCGKPKAFCSCRSTMDAGKARSVRTHNNKALRRAQDLIRRKEDAYLWFRRHDGDFPVLVGQGTYSAVLYDLYRHQVPSTPFEDVAGPLRRAGIDPSPLLAGWQSIR